MSCIHGGCKVYGCIKEATFYRCCCRPLSRMFSIRIPSSDIAADIREYMLMKLFAIVHWKICRPKLPWCIYVSFSVHSLELILGYFPSFCFKCVAIQEVAVIKQFRYQGSSPLARNATMLVLVQISSWLENVNLRGLYDMNVRLYFVARWISSMERLSLVTMLTSLGNISHCTMPPCCSVARMSMYRSVYVYD